MRPQRAAGIEIVESDGGLLVRQAERQRHHPLNNTASIICELCDGQRTLVQIAEALAEAFELKAPRWPRPPRASRNSVIPESCVSARITQP
jgi:hypothetical protein